MTPTTTPTTAPPKGAWLPYILFQETMQQRQISAIDLCKALGCATSSYRRWEALGYMPRAIGLACAYLTTTADFSIKQVLENLS